MATGNAEVIAALLTAGANLEAQVEKGYTPLHEAANAGTAEAIAALLHAGAHLEARNVGGLTPLHAAAVLGNAEAIEALKGKSPFDLIKDIDQIKGTDGYWKLHQTQFE